MKIVYTTLLTLGLIVGAHAAAPWKCFGDESKAAYSERRKAPADSRYNVQTLGAVCDSGTTDNALTLNNIIASACTEATGGNASTPVVYFPGCPSKYYGVKSPVIVRCGYAIDIVGDSGPSVSMLQNDRGGPALVFEGAGYVGSLGTLSTINILRGKGSALKWTADHYYNINEVNPRFTPTLLNGLPAFSFETCLNFPASATNGMKYSVSSSAGQIPVTKGIDQPGAWESYVTSGARTSTFTACLNLSVSGFTCISSSIPNSTNECLQVSYDGSYLRLLTGAPGSMSTSAAPVAAKGTIVQARTEAFLLGCPAESQFPFGDWGADGGRGRCFRGIMDSPRFSRIARNTSNYRMPTIKPTLDAKHIAAVLGTAFDDAFVEADAVPTHFNYSWLYAYRSVLDGGHPPGLSEVKQMYVNGQDGAALLAEGPLYGFVVDSNLGGAPAVRLSKTAYGWTFRDSQLGASNNALSVIQADQNSGILNFDNDQIQSAGVYTFALTNGAATGSISNTFIQVGNNNLAIIAVEQQGTPSAPLEWDNPIIDNENGAQDNMVLAAGIFDLNIVGGNLSGYRGLPLFQLYPNLGSIGAMGSITLIGTFAESFSSLFNFGNPSTYGYLPQPAKWINGTTFNGCCGKKPLSSLPTSAISNDMTQVSIEDSQTVTGLPPSISSCGNDPGAVIGDRNKFSFRVGGGTVTSCVLGFPPNDFANAPWCNVLDITQGSALKQSHPSNAGVTLSAPSGVTSINGDTIQGICSSNG